MSYTIDVYRGKAPATRNFWDFCTSLCLLFSPIDRRSDRTWSTPPSPNSKAKSSNPEEGLGRGLCIFLWGLFLKVVIADNLAKIIDPIFLHFTEQDVGMVLLVSAHSPSRYSAIRLFVHAHYMAHAMGISLMENFKRPDFSKNISEFWRRWHISLSSWFRDYVFSPFYIFCEKRRWLSGPSMPPVRRGVFRRIAFSRIPVGAVAWRRMELWFVRDLISGS